MPELADRVRLLRSHGERPRYHHRVVGATARLDALQAAVLRRKLTRLDGWNEERRRLGAALRERLTGAGGAAVVDPVRLPFAEADHVYHLFVVRCAERDALREHLVARGVATRHPLPRADPPHRRLRRARAAARQPARERGAGQRICSLPIFPGMTAAELEQVVEAVAKPSPGGTVGSA